MTSAKWLPARIGGAALLWAIMSAGIWAGPAAAQTDPAPVRGLENFAAPAPQATPAIPIPAPARIVLPTATPTPAAPTPAATPRSRASRAAVAADEPVTRPSPTPAPARPPAAGPTPPAGPSAAPTPAPTVPAVAGTAPPAPAPIPATPPATTPSGSAGLPSFWLAVFGGLVIVAAAAAFRLRRRRIAPAEAAALPVMDERASPGVAETSAAAPVQAAPRPAKPVQSVPEQTGAETPAAPRARLAIAYRPIRAGLNMISATVESEIVVTNTGDAPAEAIRVEARLLGAHAGQEAELAEARDAPIARPATPPFSLAPGEERRVTTVSALPREAIPSLVAGGRPMFVPLVSVNLLYRTAGRPVQTTGAYAIGIERVDSPKLAPLWLDGPARMYEAVAARPNGATLERQPPNG